MFLTFVGFQYGFIYRFERPYETVSLYHFHYSDQQHQYWFQWILELKYKDRKKKYAIHGKHH